MERANQSLPLYLWTSAGHDKAAQWNNGEGDGGNI